MNQSELKAANRRAAWRWGSLIVGLLGLQVAGGIYAIILASGDDSVAVVPDYHQKALQWDEEMAVRRASDALGWTCDVQAVPTDDRETAGLVATLKDNRGGRVNVRTGTLRWYQHIRANDVAELALPDGELTIMRLDDCFDANGLWEVLLDITDHSGNRFVHTVTVKIENIKTVSLTSTEAT